MMKISILLPTRDRPALLRQSIEALWSTLSSSDDTSIIVGVDDDDPQSEELYWEIFDNRNCFMLRVSHPRPDTMGEKYNALARAAPADLYVAWADDVAMTTPGWDRRLRRHTRHFGTEPGFVFSGEPGMVALPTLYSMNHAMFTELGYFAPEWFPNWWCETWITEIALLTGRVLYLDVPVKYEELQAASSTGRGRTQGLRDLAFWVEFFEITRITREFDASNIMLKYDPPWRRVKMLREWPILRQLFEQCFTKKLRENSSTFENLYCIDASSPDERYARAKRKAVEWLRLNQDLTKRFPYLQEVMENTKQSIPGEK